jgi:hypothetical protein
VIVGFVEDSRSLAALSKTCQGFNIAICDELYEAQFVWVGMGGEGGKVDPGQFEVEGEV